MEEPVSTSTTPVLGESRYMRAIATLIDEIADTDAPVLIRGECGVGKDFVARAIHAASARRAKPFVKVYCAAIPAGLLDSELFGPEWRARPGAPCGRPGQFAEAAGGSLYLDEIAELPHAVQAKLVRVLADADGGRSGRSSDAAARLIASAGPDLEDAIAIGELRADLFLRLSAVDIWVPPLRERPEDVAALALTLLAKYNAHYGRRRQISPAAMARLERHAWPGNVRELENVIRRLVVLDGEQVVDALPVGDGSRRTPSPVVSLHEVARRAVRDAERKALREVLEAVCWNQAEAARVLKVSHQTVVEKVAEFGLAPAI
jgi:transcriptional regulator with PAS, ATPase and Fis domain